MPSLNFRKYPIPELEVYQKRLFPAIHNNDPKELEKGLKIFREKLEEYYLTKRVKDYPIRKQAYDRADNVFSQFLQALIYYTFHMDQSKLSRLHFHID